LAENLTRLAPRLFHVHVKDAARRAVAKPDELIARGFRHGWNQFIAVDMENEWWVHPSGRKISRDISTWKPGETQPERAKPDEEQPEIQKPPPPPEGCKELSDVTLSILRDTISTETAVQLELEGVKSQLEKLNKTADDYPQHYNQYIESLEALKGRLATTADDIETMRDQLTEMNCPVSLIDSQLQELMDLQIWVDIESSPMGTQFLEPITVGVKDPPDDDDDDE